MAMTIAVARLTVKEALNKMARLEPEEARDLERAIHVLLDAAVAREVRRIGIDLVGEAEMGRPKGERDPDSEGG
jgi:hypothetical protein